MNKIFNLNSIFTKIILAVFSFAACKFEHFAAKKR